MRVLVVGGTEFISLALVRALMREAHAVTVLNRGRRRDRLPPTWDWYRKEGLDQRPVDFTFEDRLLASLPR